MSFSAVAIAQDNNVTDANRPDFLSGYTPKLHVRNILITGNKKTRDYIILREMQIKKGDSVVIAQLNDELQKATTFIYNTTLFVNVDVSPIIVDAWNLDLVIHVKERWYIFPIPYFEFADRSFNEWVKKYNADINRISYGVMFSHLNFSGRKDQFLLTVINGFKRNISFEYIAPYTNSALTNGIRIAAGFFQTREIPFKTDFDNNLVYFKNKDFVKNEWYIKAGYSYQKKIKRKETFYVGFRHLRIDDSIISFKNPEYFNSVSPEQNFVELEYKLQYNDVNNVLYPLKGYAYLISFKKQGLEFKGGINSFSIKGNYKKFFSLSRQWYSSIRLSGEIKFPFEQPFYNQKALGYEEDYMRGNEYFVIDGIASAVSKFDLKKKLLYFEIPTYLNSRTYHKIPFAIYAKTYADFGYVFSKGIYKSGLSNQFLYSGGFGIDIVTLYDFKISIEYSLNQLQQNGLFLHH